MFIVEEIPLRILKGEIERKVSMSKDKMKQDLLENQALNSSIIFMQSQQLKAISIEEIFKMNFEMSLKITVSTP